MEKPTLPLKLDRGNLVSVEGDVTLIPYYKVTSVPEEGWEKGKLFDLCSSKTKIDPRYTILAVKSLEIIRTCGDGTTQTLCRYNIDDNPLVFPISEPHKDLNQTAFLLISLSRKRQPKNDKPHKGWNFNFSLMDYLTQTSLTPVKPGFRQEFIPIETSEVTIVTADGVVIEKVSSERVGGSQQHILSEALRRKLKAKRNQRLGRYDPEDSKELVVASVEDARKMVGNEAVDHILSRYKK